MKDTVNVFIVTDIDSDEVVALVEDKDVGILEFEDRIERLHKKAIAVNFLAVSEMPLTSVEDYLQELEEGLKG